MKPINSGYPKNKTVFALAPRSTPSDRMLWIDELKDTLPGEPLPSPTWEWFATIPRRSKEFAPGFSQRVSWEQVKARELRRLGLKGSDDSR